MMNFGLLLFVIPFVQSLDSDDSTGCPEWSSACHKDCCYKKVQFCNEEEKRCTRCDARQWQCGTPHEPVGCHLYCYQFLLTTTTSATTTTVPTTTPTSASPTTEETKHVKVHLNVLIPISVAAIVLLVVCGVFICVLLKKRKTMQENGKKDEEAAEPLAPREAENTADRSRDRSTHSLTGNSSNRSSLANASNTSEEADPNNIPAEVRLDTDSAEVEAPVRDDGETRLIPTTAAPAVATPADENGRGLDRNIGSNARTLSPGNLGEPPPIATSAIGENGPTATIGENGPTATIGENGPTATIGENGPTATTGETGPMATIGTFGAAEANLASAIELRPPNQDQDVRGGAPHQGNHECRDGRLSRLNPTIDPHHKDQPCVIIGTDNPAACYYSNCR